MTATAYLWSIVHEGTCRVCDPDGDGLTYVTDDGVCVMCADPCARIPFGRMSVPVEYVRPDGTVIGVIG